MSPFALSQWIKVDRSVARSINLERDSTDRLLLERFQVTPTASKILIRLADALTGEPVNAWSLTGPYGTGKSAFCNFLLSLMGGDLETRVLCYNKICDADNDLSNRFNKFLSLNRERPPVFTVRAVSRYESLNSTLARSLCATLKSITIKESNNELKELQKCVEELSEKEWPPTGKIAEAFSSLVRITERPVFLVVDEFGKNLEFQAHHAQRGDIFALQSLAELRSVFIWVCLHQAFSSYSNALSRVQREEWQKIQGRFEDHPYIEPPTRSFGLIRDALTIEPLDPIHEEKLVDWAQAMKKAVSSIKLNGLPLLKEEEIKSLYPFHPISVYLIGEMSRRFAQNDRTIFSFLSSGEPNAFSACLRRMVSGYDRKLPTLGLDALYDYFSNIGMHHHSDRFENQRWIEINTIISSRNGISPEKRILLKTIGVLNLLSSLPGIVASEDMIHATLFTNYYKKKSLVKSMLHDLVQEKILLFRGYAREYRLWEGSDFELDREVLEARGRVALRPVSETLEEMASRPRLVAARHSFQTGTLREFAVRWCTEDNLSSVKENPRAKDDGDGTIWLMLGRGRMPGNLSEITKSDCPVIIGHAPCLEQVRQLMLEAAACQEACNAPQLERDGVARREARYRAAQATQSVLTFLDEVFSPGTGSALWFAEGKLAEIHNQRELSALASDLCDRIYYQCPRINNEMLNVDKLSGMGAAARNKVGEALANQYMCEDLGLTGYGPDVAVYRSVIKDSGLHRRDTDGKWILSPPDRDSQPQLAALWDFIDNTLAKADSEGQSVPVRQIVDALKKPPFGLREGPIPLLLVHYLLIHADEVAVYEENVFKPFFGDAEVILLMRRPELFSLRSYQTSGIRSNIIRTYYQVVNTQLRLADGVRNKTMLSIVVPLTEFYKSLPEYTRTTRALSPNALRLRNAIANARDPQQLLYNDVPDALGLPTLDPGISNLHFKADSKDLQKALWIALTELRDAFDIFTNKIIERFSMSISNHNMESCRLHLLRHDLRQKAALLLPVCTDNNLKPMLSALSQEKKNDTDWFSQVAAIIMQKPIHSWQEADIEPFIMRAEEINQRINHLYEVKRRTEKKGYLNNSTRFIGFFHPEKGLFEKTMTFPSKSHHQYQEFEEMFENADPEGRAEMLAWLLDYMLKKGDFK